MFGLFDGLTVCVIHAFADYFPAFKRLDKTNEILKNKSLLC